MFESTVRVLVMVLLLFGAQPSMAEPGRFCTQAVVVEIERLVPRISFKGQEENRLDRIVLMMPIDCDDGSPLRPSTLTQALDWLDRALPVNYKAGLLKGNTFMNSPYGSSVDGDVADFLQDHWKLDAAPLCAVAIDKIDREFQFCGFVLLMALKQDYLKSPCSAGICAGTGTAD